MDCRESIYRSFDVPGQVILNRHGPTCKTSVYVAEAQCFVFVCAAYLVIRIVILLTCFVTVCTCAK